MLRFCDRSSDSEIMIKNIFFFKEKDERCCASNQSFRLFEHKYFLGPASKALANIAIKHNTTHEFVRDLLEMLTHGHDVPKDPCKLLGTTRLRLV